MTEADGNQTFMFAFDPLSGLADIENGFVHNGINGGSEYPVTFNMPYCDANRPDYWCSTRPAGPPRWRSYV